MRQGLNGEPLIFDCEKAPLRGPQSLKPPALPGDTYLGAAAMRDDSHLFQLFVSTRLQGRGIARRLWQRTMRDAVRRAGTRHFTLNASVMAVPVYRRFGFMPSGPLTIGPSGLVTQPMRLELR